MKKTFFLILIALLTLPFTLSAQQDNDEHPGKTPVKEILFVGDSMTGWLSEALNAYGRENGFEVSTVVWDGSTISKWGNGPKLASLVKEYDPDALFVSLGMNELFDAKPDHLRTAVDNIKAAAGARPILWVGPPSWPGQKKGEILNDWLEKELGDGSFFRSFDLDLPRQNAKNVHPSRQGMIQWVDSLMNWIPGNAQIELPGYRQPSGQKMVRGKNFIYKRMKESL